MRVPLGVALTAQDFAVLVGAGDDFDRLPVGDGAQRLRRLLTAGADGRRLRQTFGRHAVEGLLRHVGRQIGAQDPHVDDVDAEIGHARTDQVARFAHHRRPFDRQRGVELAQAIDLAQRRVEARGDTLLGEIQVALHPLAELDRIGDAVGEEGVDHVGRAVADLQLHVGDVVAQQPVFDDLHRVDERGRQLEVEPGLGPHRR